MAYLKKQEIQVSRSNTAKAEINKTKIQKNRVFLRFTLF
jgi:hypothetical protein